MNIGMMWLITTKVPLDGILIGIARTKEKYGVEVGEIHLHLEQDAETVTKLRELGYEVVLARYILKNAVWMGRKSTKN